MNVVKETPEQEKPIKGVKEIATYLKIDRKTLWRNRSKFKIYGSGKMQFAFPSELTNSIKSL